MFSDELSGNAAKSARLNNLARLPRRPSSSRNAKAADFD
jgi:hypothetical protein